VKDQPYNCIVSEEKSALKREKVPPPTRASRRGRRCEKEAGPRDADAGVEWRERGRLSLSFAAELFREQLACFASFNFGFGDRGLLHHNDNSLLSRLISPVMRKRAGWR